MAREGETTAASGVRLMSAHRVSAPDDADFYPTPPWGGRAGGELIRRLDPHAVDAWEPACGEGHLAYALEDYFPRVLASDAFGYRQNRVHDFVGAEPPPFEADWIITNPPFNLAGPFIIRARALARRGVAMLMRAAALETLGRFPIMFGDAPLSVFAPFCERLPMHKDRWEPQGSTAAFYAWFIWLKPGVGPDLGPRPVVMPIAPGSRTRLARPDDAIRWGVA